MKTHRRAVAFALALCIVSFAGASAQETKKPFTPVEGQAGRDVVWVPTPFVLVEKMLDMAKVTPQDFVMDLGSGDGRNVIGAARRGARALGVEYNPDMVELSRQLAVEAGVSDKATFVQGDMYEADVSKATVLALFLLTENMDRLAPKFLAMRPGTRIVSNGFTITGWATEAMERAEGNCGSWCTSYLYLVPANVAGAWRLGAGELTLEQTAQLVHGTLATGGHGTPVQDGKLSGEHIRFSVGDTKYEGRVEGNTMGGAMSGARTGAWTATRK